MNKYAKIVDEITKLCSVGIGTDSEFYKSIGMTEMEVEQAYDGQWYVKGYTPSQPLDELKQAKINEFKAIRDTKEVEPINNYDVDKKSLMRIDIACKMLAGTEHTIYWTMADNTIEQVSYEDLMSLYDALAIRSNKLHVKYRELKEQIEACESKEQLDEISWGE